METDFVSNFDFYQHTLERLKRHAELDHSQFGQYRGHFAEFRLAYVTKDSGKYKGGSRFLKGDYVIAKPLNRTDDPGKVEVYCPVTGHLCQLGEDHLTWVE